MHKLQAAEGSMPVSHGCVEISYFARGAVVAQMAWARAFLTPPRWPASVFTGASSTGRKRAHTSRIHAFRIESSVPGLHSPRGRCSSRSPALAARDGAPGAVEASRVQAHAGPRRPRSCSRREQLPALQTPYHLGSADTGARREQRAATAPTRRETPKGCRRADADPGQPHAAAARRGKQQAA